MRRLALMPASMLVHALLVASAVAARRQRATRGEAQAALEAFGNGGWAVINHSREARARRGPANTRVAIRPHDFFDGRHYCALDWHTIVSAFIEGGDKPFTQSQAAASIADARIQFTLDGTPLAGVSQGPVKRFLNAQQLFGLEVAFYSQWGRIMEPSDLAVGQHTLGVVWTSASTGQTQFQNTINFFIDAEGTGACRK